MRDSAPTVRQIYALAAELSERAQVDWPATRTDASDLIERLRRENGHPAPRLVDTPLRPRRRRDRRGERAQSRWTPFGPVSPM